MGPARGRQQDSRQGPHRRGSPEPPARRPPARSVKSQACRGQAGPTSRLACTLVFIASLGKRPPRVQPLCEVLPSPASAIMGQWGLGAPWPRPQCPAAPMMWGRPDPADGTGPACVCLLVAAGISRLWPARVKSHVLRVVWTPRRTMLLGTLPRPLNKPHRSSVCFSLLHSSPGGLGSPTGRARPMSRELPEAEAGGSKEKGFLGHFIAGQPLPCQEALSQSPRGQLGHLTQPQAVSGLLP